MMARLYLYLTGDVELFSFWTVLNFINSQLNQFLFIILLVNFLELLVIEFNYLLFL